MARKEKEKMKHIYYVRHGETESNVAMVFSGSGNDTVLTETGKKQAKMAGEALRGKGIEIIIASPMKRTKQTAEIIAKQIKFPTEKIKYDDLLVERGFGYYEGKPHAKMQEDKDAGIKRDMGEDLQDVHDRVLKVIKKIQTGKEKTNLIVSHGGIGRVMRIIDRELSAADFHEVERFENCEIDEFTV